MFSIFSKINQNQLLVRVILLLVSACSWVSADQGAGWFQAQQSNLQLRTTPADSSSQSPKKSVAMSAAVASSTAAPAPAAVSTLPVAQEIRDLANALGNDPLALFNWVRNHVDYKHYRGAKKGSLTTLVELSGNDCDQSLLLRDLLTAAGIPARLNYGKNWIPYQSETGADIRHWLGLPQAAFENDHADRMLLDRGTKSSEAEKTSTQILLKRIWVEATIQGQMVQMDPSFKKYEQVTGVDLAATSGYQQAAALGQLAGAVADGNRSLANANETALGVYLKDRSAALVQAFKQTGNVGKTPLDVTGGWRLLEWTAASLTETFPLDSYLLDSQWDIPPADQQATIRFRLGYDPQNGQYDREVKMNTSELAGRRLTLGFSGNAIMLSLDGLSMFDLPYLVAQSVNLEIQITHPTGDTRLNQTFQQSYKRTVTANGMPNGTAIYALIYGFDVSRESLRRRERVLEKYKAEGLADNSPEVMGETLNIIGQQWYLQTEEVESILSALTGCAPQMHHRIGRVAQEEGLYIDVMGQLFGMISGTSDPEAQYKNFAAAMFYGSAMEHGVLDQLQNTPAASTVGLISRANALVPVGKVFVMRNIADYNTLRSQSTPQLSGYSTADRQTFKDTLNAGGTVVCPANADLKLNPTDLWHGAGYVLATPPTNIVSGRILMIISGGYQGGYSVNNWLSDTTQIFNSNYSAPAKINFTPVSLPRSVSYDPVDLQTGNFLISGRPDLAVGSTLAFSRTYDGARSTRDVAGVGYGWTHSGNLLLTERTSVESALGHRSPADMAAMLASAVTVLDLFQNRDAGTDYQKKWVGSLLAAKWAVDQLKNNSVTVQLPDKTLEFIRQPDGSFSPPPGISVVLAKNSTTNRYTITPRNGSTTTFEPVVPTATGQYRIKQTTDLWARSQTYTYDATSGKLTTMTDPFGRSLTLTYQGGRLSSLSDSTGRSVSYTYDAVGNLSKFTDAEGKADLFLYDSLHRITETRDPSGRAVVKNFYDDQGRVIQQDNQGLASRSYFYDYAPGVTREKDPTGAVTQHLFDARNRDIGSINGLGQRVRIGYDAQDRKVSETSALGRTSSSTYDANDNLLTTTDPTGATTLYGYDIQNRVTSVTDPLSRASTMTYNGKHQILTTTNAQSEKTTNGYADATGYLTSSTNSVGPTTITGGSTTYALETVTSFLYDGYGQMTRSTLPDLSFVEQSTTARGDLSWATDARGIRTDFTYNARRERTSAIQGGRVTSTAYDTNRMPWRTTNARNFATTSTYSASEKPLTLTGPDGAKLTTTYEMRDLPQTTTGPLGETSSTAYDALSRPQVSTDPLNRSVTQNYDADGMPTTTLAPLGRTSSVAYQIGVGLPRLTTQTNPLSHTSLTEVDAAGQTRFVTNRRGQVFELRYDALGRVLKTIQPGGRTLTAAYGWNATGRTSSLTEPSTQTTALQYNKRGQIITRTGPDATTSYNYDASGNLLTATEGAAVLTRTYETTRDAVSSYTNAAGDQISYTYDANGNLSTLTYPGGKIVSYGYDSSDRLVKVTDWAGRVTRCGYDLSGRQVWLQRPNGTLRRMAYDAAGQQTLFTEVRKNGAPIASQSWRYDVGGRAVQRTRNPSAVAFTPPTYAAAYHPDNRLNTLTPGGSSAVTVASDLDGNITSVPLWELTRSWQTASLTWDARNRLTAITTPSGYVSYRYDAEGNLIYRSQNSLSSFTNRYTVDPTSRLSQQLIEHRPDGSKVFYIFGGGLLYEENFNASNVSQGTRSYHFDQVGSTVALTDDSGAVTGRLEYTAYGVTSHTSGTVDTKFRYNGQYGVQTDLTTGLLQMRARWYSPGLGRFLSEDPAGFSGGMNWYVYADGNPISLSDPFGLCADRNSCTGGTGRGSPYASDQARKLGMATEIALGFTPVGVVMDIGSMGQAGYNGDMGGIGMAAVGFLPFGDFAKLGKAAKSAPSFFEGATYTPKVLQQASRGAGEFHSFPESVAAFESAGTVRAMTGGDKVVRQVLEIPGSYRSANGNMSDGVFQWIKNPDNTINHRLFVPNP